MNFKKFADYLGLAMSDETKENLFTIVDNNNEVIYKTCKITNAGIFVKNENGLYDLVMGDVYLKLMGEELLIKKSVYYPKSGEVYYYNFEGEAFETTWDNNVIDYENYYLGNCFATETGAIVVGNKLAETFKEFYEKEGHNLNAEI